MMLTKRNRELNLLECVWSSMYLKQLQNLANLVGMNIIDFKLCVLSKNTMNFAYLFSNVVVLSLSKVHLVTDIFLFVHEVGNRSQEVFAVAH